MKKLSLFAIMVLALSTVFIMGCRDNKESEPVPEPAPASPEAAAPPPAEITPPAAVETTPPEVATVPQPSAPVNPGADASLTTEFLIRQKFNLKQVNGAAFTSEQAPFIEFGENFMVTGKICNNFRGPGQLNGGILTVRDIASTRMACPDQELGHLENMVFQMLENGAEISMDGSRLFLKQGNNTLVFEAATITTASI